jgi:hypothetical protein
MRHLPFIVPRACGRSILQVGDVEGKPSTGGGFRRVEAMSAGDAPLSTDRREQRSPVVVIPRGRSVTTARAVSRTSDRAANPTKEAPRDASAAAWRIGGLASALALVLAACGEPLARGCPAAMRRRRRRAEPRLRAAGDGPLSFLRARPDRVGEAGVEEINDAGGVLGQPIPEVGGDGRGRTAGGPRALGGPTGAVDGASTRRSVRGVGGVARRSSTA